MLAPLRERARVRNEFSLCFLKILDRFHDEVPSFIVFNGMPNRSGAAKQTLQVKLKTGAHFSMRRNRMTVINACRCDY